MFDFVSRRSILALAAVGVPSAMAPAVAAEPRRSRPAGATTRTAVAAGHELGLTPDSPEDQSVALQAAIDQAALNRVTLQLPAGILRASGAVLRERSHVIGSPGTRLQAVGGGAVLTAERAHGARLERVRVEGAGNSGGETANGALIEIRASHGIAVDDLTLSRAARNGIYLEGCSGRVRGCRIENVGAAALWAMNSLGLEIVGNDIAKCGDNGILVWRSAPGDDATLVAQNRIAHIFAVSGGSGQNGNGVNVFRAGGVLVTGNHISDCAYSAVRGNAASNIQIVANSAARIGEVALYAEFGFEGALIAQNVVDASAAGISVTNFNEGGRLAVVQGNLVRNLRRREHEPVDKRGEGISIEADAAVSGNTIEGAPTAGIVIGWGRYMRNVTATGNLIRGAGVGIMITKDADAGSCLVAQNLISDVRDGAIRLMDLGRPVGEDLALSQPRAGRIAIGGNVVSGGGA
ncbi:MAG: TIGR03808 family TAT-translocated repetitive protein [Hyphomicrobiaceae bacterium]